MKEKLDMANLLKCVSLAIALSVILYGNASAVVDSSSQKPNLTELAKQLTKAPEGYIVEFKDLNPLLKEKLDLEKSGLRGSDLTNRLKDQKNNIQKTQSDFEKQLKVVNKSAVIKRRYLYVLNGIAVKGENVTKEQLEGLGFNVKVSPDLEVFPALMDSVPLIHADQVWHLNAEGHACIPAHFPPRDNGDCLTGRGITIGIIDSGVDYTHPDLGGCFGPNCKVVGGYDFYNNDLDPMDDNGHGTHVASIAAGKSHGSGGLNGVAPDAKIYAFKITGSTGHLSDPVAAIERSFDLDNDGFVYGIDPEETNPHDILDVINMSFASLWRANDDPLVTAVNNATDYGIICVAAMGNWGPDTNTLLSPATSPKAISVGASCKPFDVGYPECPTDIASFSGRGPNENGQIKPDVVAPGFNIYSPKMGGGYETFTGTSASTPHVSGVAALLKQAHPNWKPEEIKMLIKHTASYYQNGEGPIAQGRGLVDALAAVHSQQKPPVIHAQIPYYVYLGSDFDLDYEVSYDRPGNIVIEKAVSNDPNFNNLTFEPVSSEPFTPPYLHSSTPIDPTNQNSIGEVYRVKFVDNASGEQYFEDVLFFSLPPHIMPGWPLRVTTAITDSLWGVESGRLRSESTSDVMVKTLRSLNARLYDYQASNRITLQRDIMPQERASSRSLFFDLNRDLHNEFILDSHVYNGDLNPIITLPAFPSIDSFVHTPIITDVNGDGINDIIQIVTSREPNPPVPSNGNVWITNSVTGEHTVLPITFFWLPDEAGLEGGGYIAVGDLDNDGKKEIVSNALDVISFTGNGYETRPYHIQGVPIITEGHSAFGPIIVIGDLNLNGTNEIILVNGEAVPDVTDISFFQVYIIENGTVTHNYISPPRPEIDPGSASPSPGRMEPILGNFVRNNKLEILISTENYFYLFDSEANLIQQSPHADMHNYFRYSPFTYNIDGDGTLEILLFGDRLYIYNNYLELIDSHIDLLGHAFSILGSPSWPFLEDLDGDGRLDLLTSTWGGVFNNAVADVFAWDIHLPHRSPQEMKRYWINFGYDKGNTRCYMCDAHPHRVPQTATAD